MISIDSFTDELEKIANAAKITVRYGRRLAKGVAKATSKNTLRTVRDFGTPVKSIKKGVKHDFKDIAKKGIKGMNLGHALNVAGAASTAGDAFRKEDVTGRGQSRVRRITAWAGDQAGGFVGARHGIAGAITGGLVGRRAGEMAGSAADKVIPKKKKDAA